MMKNTLLNRRRQRGFSLVELMVALVVGLVVVGALLATLSATSTSSRHSQAMAQMSQDATTALTILREQLAHVGYSHVVSVDAKGKFVKAYPGGVAGYTSGPGLSGCSASFTDADAATIDALTCDKAGSDAIAVAYEADDKNDVSTGGVPLDCVGNSLAKVGAGANQFYLADNRFYLDTPKGAAHKALYCRGNGGAGSAQALVENIDDMKILYGVSANPGAAPPVQVGYYAPASSLNPGAAPLTPGYANVVSVRVCVLVVSAEKVMEKVDTAYPKYRDCDDVEQDGDAYMRRAFTSTVVLQNTLTF